MFFCEFCEIFKNTFFTGHLWTTFSRSTDRIIFGGIYIKGQIKHNINRRRILELDNFKEENNFLVIERYVDPILETTDVIITSLLHLICSVYVSTKT